MISKNDSTVLRSLAERVREFASDPVMEQRRELWRLHNSLSPMRPMLLVFPEGSWRELIPEGSLECRSENAREIESQLKRRIYYCEHLQDDTVIEEEWIVSKVIHSSGWGMEPRRIASPDRLGAWRFDPVIKAPKDLTRLKTPQIIYDEKATEETLAEVEELFGDILRIRLKGVCRISYHLMQQYSYLRGLEETMADMVLNPGMLHEGISLLTEGQKQMLRQYREQNLLSLNNDGTYHSSGGNGYTDELPTPDYNPDRVWPADMWASAESQELAQVSPEHHEEFALRYERELLEPFGLTGYGCCEDLTDKLDDVLRIPHIRRISISPWADVERCAEKLGGGAIFSWKPNPAHLVGSFDEERIKRYIRRTVEAARAGGCALEIILKDTHTCENRPERFDRWLSIARDEVE